MEEGQSFSANTKYHSENLGSFVILRSSHPINHCNSFSSLRHFFLQWSYRGKQLMTSLASYREVLAPLALQGPTALMPWLWDSFTHG